MCREEPKPEESGNSRLRKFAFIILKAYALQKANEKGELTATTLMYRVASRILPRKVPETEDAFFRTGRAPMFAL